MKCVVLAGGKGGSLWPLSRKNYPIQFAEIRDKRSAFQEIIARHLPYCDEFYIFTNNDYRYIAEGQLEIFQKLNYKLFLEEESVNTTLPVVLASMMLENEDKFLVVGCNAIYDGAGFRECFNEAMQVADNYPCELMGMPVNGYDPNVGYIKYNINKADLFVEKPNKALFESLKIDAGWLYNTCKYLINVKLFSEYIKNNFKSLYDNCKDVFKSINIKDNIIGIPVKTKNRDLSMSFERSILSYMDNLGVIKLKDIEWKVIGDFDSVGKIIRQDAFENVVEKNCENLTVINFTNDQLVVANGLSDAIIVNTGDTVYVEGNSPDKDIKDFFVNHEQQYSSYVNDAVTKYRKWGKYVVTSRQNGYVVKEVTLYPHKEMTMHKHEHRSEHWSIVEGTAEITIDDKTSTYQANTSVFVPKNSYHKIANKTDKNVVIIEVEIGQIITEADINSKTEAKEIIKLEPVFKDYLWGGTRLRDEYGKQSDLDIIAESWELSTHPAGNSIIASGTHKGMLFGEYIDKYREEVVGWKCKAFSKFPILIKLIDSRQALSVQVHPDDDFAMAYENEYGKNEMWYIVDCDEDAFIYCGFNKNLTEAEISERLRHNIIEEVLNKIPVHKGDAYFIPAGTVHAIGKGILICEIQQNSNCTYRLYDYNRRDKNGNLRELHIDKALQVLNMDKYEPYNSNNDEIADENENVKKELCACKYFEVTAVKLKEKYDFTVDLSSFTAIVAVNGNGTIKTGAQSIAFKRGETMFLPAGIGDVRVNGNCELVISHI